MFKKLKSIFGKDPAKAAEQVLNESLQMINSGDPVGGLRRITGFVSELESSQPGTPVLAVAYFNAAIAYLSNGQNDEAVGLLEKACAIRGTDHASRKDRLTYLMNLGEVLTNAGRLEEAEKHLRIGLEERKRFYEENHPGIAFGLTPLAANLLTQNRAEEALPLIDQAIQINFAAGQMEAGSDMAIRGLIIKSARGEQVAAFEQWDQLPPELQNEVVDHLVTRASMLAPSEKEMARLYAFTFLELTTRDLSNLSESNRINTSAMLNNMACTGECHELRVNATKRVLKEAIEKADPDLIIESYLALALALSDNEELEQAEKAYKLAFQEAKKAGDPARMSGVLRNLGLFYSEQDRMEEAEKTLNMAVTAAGKSNDDEMTGRAMVAYGIFMQHQDRLEDARPVLVQGIEKLPLAHADRFCGMSHLFAIRDNLPCPCNGDTGARAASAIVEEIVRQSLPGDLLKSISLGDEMSVELSREPTEEEVQNLHELINVAMGQVRSGMRGMG